FVDLRIEVTGVARRLAEPAGKARRRTVAIEAAERDAFGGRGTRAGRRRLEPDAGPEQPARERRHAEAAEPDAATGTPARIRPGQAPGFHATRRTNGTGFRPAATRAPWLRPDACARRRRSCALPRPPAPRA